MLLVFTKVLVVFIYAGIGFAANKLNVLPEESSKYFNNLIMSITCPCLVLSSITDQELDDNTYLNTIMTFAVGTFMFLFIMMASSFFSDHFFRRRDQDDKNVLASAMTGCNSGFMGFPITQSVFGPQIFYYIVIHNIANNLYLFVLSFIHLHHKDRNRAAGNWKSLFKPLINPTAIMTVVAVVMLFTGLKLPAYAMDIVTTVGDVTIPLSMMMVGVRLGGSNFRKVFTDRDILITALIKNLAVPGLVMLVVTLLPLANVVKLILVFGMCFPSGVIGVVTAERENKNPQLMAEAVAGSTVLSVITLPLWIMICTRMYL